MAKWRASGISERKFRLLVESGDLVCVRRGSYVTKEIFAEAQNDSCLGHAVKVAALMAASRRRDCVASHHSAARIHGLELLHPPGEPIITITVPTGQKKTGRPKETDVVRHAAELPGSHVTEFRGVPVTTVARTVDPAGVVSCIRFAFERGMDPAAIRRRARFRQAIVRPD